MYGSYKLRDATIAQADPNGGSEMEATIVDEVMTGEINMLEEGDPASHARRMMDTNELRSLLVVDNDHPVGLVQWQTLLHADDLDRPVSEFMTTDFPTIRQGESIDEVNQRLHQDINIDQVPVVAETGVMVGAVDRRYLGVSSEPTGGSTEEENEPPAGGTPVREGMTVKDSSGSKLGELAEARFKSDGGVEFFVVQHGLIFKNQKRLPGDLIQEIEGDDVLLAIDSQEFGMMSDMGEEA